MLVHIEQVLQWGAIVVHEYKPTLDEVGRGRAACRQRIRQLENLKDKRGWLEKSEIEELRTLRSLHRKLTRDLKAYQPRLEGF